MSTTRNFPLTFDLSEGTTCQGNPKSATYVNMKAGFSITGMNANAIGTTIRLRTSVDENGLSSKPFEATYKVTSSSDVFGMELMNVDRGFNFFEVEVSPPASATGTIVVNATAFFEELNSPSKHPFSVDNDVNTKTIGTTESPVISFRIKSGSMVAEVIPTYVTILMVSNRDAMWRFYHTDAGEPNPLTNESWNDSDSENVEFDVDADAWNGSNSIKTHSGYVSSLLEVAARNLTIGLGFDCGCGLGDIYTLTAQQLTSGGTTSVNAALGWSEIE